MTVVYDNSGKTAVLTYTRLGGAPVIISAAAEGKWINIDDAEGLDMRVGADGTPFTFLKPTIVTGSLFFQPYSPPLVNVFFDVMKEQYNTAPIQGTLSIATANGLSIVTFNEFYIKSVFPGYSINERIEDVTLKFSSTIPDSTVLGDLLSIGVATLGVI